MKFVGILLVALALCLFAVAPLSAGHHCHVHCGFYPGVAVSAPFVHVSVAPHYSAWYIDEGRRAQWHHEVFFDPPVEHAHAYHVCSAYKCLAEEVYHVPVPWDWITENTLIKGYIWVKGEWSDGRSSEPILKPRGEGECSVTPEPEGKPMGSRGSDK